MLPMIPVRTANLARSDTKSATRIAPTRLASPDSKPKEAWEANHRLLSGEAMPPGPGPQGDSPIRLRAPPSQNDDRSAIRISMKLQTMHLQTEYPMFLAQWETDGGSTLDHRRANQFSNYEHNHNHHANSHHPSSSDNHGSAGITCPGKVQRLVSDQ